MERRFGSQQGSLAVRVCSICNLAWASSRLGLVSDCAKSSSSMCMLNGQTGRRKKDEKRKEGRSPEHFYKIINHLRVPRYLGSLDT